MGGSSVRAVGWARSLPMTSTAKEARDWARAHLDSLGWGQEASETVDAVLLSVSELVTNAHVHAHSSAQLVLTWDTSCLHVAVHDGSTQLPVARPPDNERLGGRGMFLVDALADTWQVRPCSDGKLVMACFQPPAEALESEAAEG
ncbi:MULTISPECIES: ATP-binding protein [Streptomyces]|uniref:ATP-binding protein n=1 Tax=Streptomyces lichenis TaxID=2306967 RepID=A0ABT0IK50_9ACTN|nr:ATP-binding protein [Streptomyces lichenis]MCK8681647.1 ATP-binding protein [Streptomyces lichenis]